MKKTIRLTVEQAKKMYEKDNSIRNTLLSEFTDEELGIRKDVMWINRFYDTIFQIKIDNLIIAKIIYDYSKNKYKFYLHRDMDTINKLSEWKKNGCKISGLHNRVADKDGNIFMIKRLAHPVLCVNDDSIFDFLYMFQEFVMGRTKNIIECWEII